VDQRHCGRRDDREARELEVRQGKQREDHRRAGRRVRDRKGAQVARREECGDERSRDGEHALLGDDGREHLVEVTGELGQPEREEAIAHER
jgi:hypothetical protein